MKFIFMCIITYTYVYVKSFTKNYRSIPHLRSAPNLYSGICNFVGIRIMLYEPIFINSIGYNVLY